MLETLLQLDRALTLSINFFHTDGLDEVMKMVSERLTWVPLYALLAFIVFKKLGAKELAVILLVAVATIALTDQLSVLMKDGFMRLRPCHEAGVQEYLHTPAGCGGMYGFVSSHAANTMGIALLFSMILQRNWLTWMLLAYAFLNGYSRIYLGKHYVLDIVGGFALGTVVAIISYRVVILILHRMKATT